MQRLAWLLLLTTAAAPALAQDPGNCPRLPPESGLTWQHKAIGNDADLCRALRADGSEAFGLYIARDTPFEPKGGDRAEEGVLDGRPIRWYRSELAGRPNVQARETLVELPDGRKAHIWVQAPTGDALRESLGLAQSMQLGAAHLSQN